MPMSYGSGLRPFYGGVFPPNSLRFCPSIPTFSCFIENLIQHLNNDKIFFFFFFFTYNFLLLRGRGSERKMRYS